MTNTDLPLDDLAVLIAVIEAQGFRAAATRLGRAPSTVSEAVARLEARIGAPLLARSTRTVRATEAGRDLAERAAPLLAGLREALEGAAPSEAVRGPLRLNVPKAVMIDILPPLLDRFLARHPEVSVEVVVEDSFVDALAAGCHAGIRYGESLDRDMISVPIGPRRQQAALAAAPTYLAARGTPVHPRDLAGHEAIAIRFASGALARWDLERGTERLVMDPPARLTVSAAAVEAAIGHAVAGRGILQAFRNWLDPHLASGALRPVLPDWWPAFDGPRLYFPSRAMPRPLRAFVDLVAEAPD